MSSYEINRETMAIIPNGLGKSKVLETDNKFDVNKNSTEIIDDSCKFFGSSYTGRFEGTKSLIGVNYKAPIIIEESRSLIFFPTSSPRFDNCIWLSLNNIDNYLKKDKDTTIINFKNGDSIDIDISYSSFENQILRASRLDLILRNRKNCI